MGHLTQYGTTGVEKAFRPLLDLIDFPNLDLNSFPDKLSFYSDLEQYLPLLKGKKCRLVLLLRDNLNKDAAYVAFSISEGVYIIIIGLSGDLFNGGLYDNPMIRNIVGIHEFLHCISIFFSIPELTNKKKGDFIKECYTKMTIEVLSIDSVIQSTHSRNIMGDQNKLFLRNADYFFPNSIFFSDDHFRLSLDKSPQKYHNLNERFLLPKDKFETFFNRNELRDLKSLIKNNKIPDAYNAAQSKLNYIALDMHLEIDFVKRRMGEILLSYAL